MSHTEVAEKQHADFYVGRSHGYRLVSKLGEGTYAEVFLAEFFPVTNPKTQSQKLACKVIDTRKTPKEYVAKFLPRELDILAKINHPHIIHIHSIYHSNFRYLIFMRLAENGDLLDYIVKSGPLSEGQTRMWVKQIALAIQYLQEMEIAHRDLKCENILVTSNYNVKIADFGFARHTVNKKGVRVLSETYCGSTSYSSPEVIRGIPYNPKISDMWSVGVIIFVMLNKAMPFDDTSLKKQYEQQIAKKWKLKPRVENTLSKQVKDIIRGILEPNTEMRMTINDLLDSEWMSMDNRLKGMTEGETQALESAKEERKRMERSFLNHKLQEKGKAKS